MFGFGVSSAIPLPSLEYKRCVKSTRLQVDGPTGTECKALGSGVLGSELGCGEEDLGIMARVTG